MSHLDKLNERELIALKACSQGMVSGLLREWPYIISALKKVGCWYSPLQRVKDYQGVCKIIVGS